MGKEKTMKRRAVALRLKEKRLQRQAGLLAQGNDILKAAEQRGYWQGVAQGLRQAQELSEKTPAKAHKQLLHRKLTEAMEEARFNG